MNENIIQETQQELLNATSEITTAVEQVVDEHAASHHGPFYIQAEFWVAVSFFLVVMALFKPVKKLGSMLINKRIEGIKTRISDAVSLKEDAQKLLAEYERKYALANSEAKEILAKAENEIDFTKKETLAKLERDMRNKEKDAESRILASQTKAESEIVDLTSSLTIQALKLAIQKKLDSKNQDKLIDESISLIAKL